MEEKREYLSWEKCLAMYWGIPETDLENIDYNDLSEEDLDAVDEMYNNQFR